MIVYIKNKLEVIAFLSLFFSLSAYGSIDFIGKSINSGNASSPVIALDENHNPYVLYQEGNESKIKKYNGYIWESLVDIGDDTPGYNTHTIDFTLSASRVPYVAYRSTKDGETIVKRLNGSSWEKIGSIAKEYSSSYHIRIAIGSDDVPWVASYNTGSKQVLRFDGSSWLPAGSFESSGAMHRLGFTLDPQSNLPYIAYSDPISSAGSLGPATVKRFNGTEWVIVGKHQFTIENVRGVDLAISHHDGAPYIVGNSTSMKFNSATSVWEELGDFNTGVISDDYRVTIGLDGTPYASFRSGDGPFGPFELNIIAFNGESWSSIFDQKIDGISDLDMVSGSLNKTYVSYVENGKINVIRISESLPKETLFILLN
ncbi:hypothetical protein [uncultured Vibrio sp.]|uniref:hypothetical protein n=1 Tax=uncultured Vibrio sp. TaxID=114054 RepID=UPI00260F172F|nr:hypothetical protein [uncultured Vibrio sp.]